MPAGIPSRFVAAAALRGAARLDRLDQLVVMLGGQQHQIIGAAAPQRFHHAGTVGFHGLDADAEVGGDFLVALAAADLAQDLALAR